LSFKYPDHQDRQTSAAAAKKAMFEKFRAASQDPTLEERRKERLVIHEARLARQAERQAEKEAARKQREAELAAQAAREAEEAAKAAREAEEAEAKRKADEAEQMVLLLADQKAKRDARYAARKAAKKMRRRGY